ncbi:MAG: hypothetical protein U1C48_03975 [Methylotenera sp.]|nr:hypothetical protein [Methylotenera sp.]
MEKAPSPITAKEPSNSLNYIEKTLIQLTQWARIELFFMHLYFALICFILIVSTYRFLSEVAA